MNPPGTQQQPVVRIVQNGDDLGVASLSTHILQQLNREGIDARHVRTIVATCRDHRCQRLALGLGAGLRAPFMAGGLAGVPAAGSLGIDAALGSAEPDPDTAFTIVVALTHANAAGAQHAPGCAALGVWQQHASRKEAMPDAAEMQLLDTMLTTPPAVSPDMDQEAVADILAVRTSTALREWVDASTVAPPGAGAMHIAATLIHTDDGDELRILDTIVNHGDG